MAIFQAAMAAIGLIGGAQTARIQAKASMKMAEEQTKQSKAKQEELNSGSELARAIQKINNDRVMRSADKTFAAAATNLNRNRAATQTSNVMQQIAEAEAAGAYSANVASKGIGGGSVEVIENTMALRDAIKNQSLVSWFLRASRRAIVFSIASTLPPPTPLLATFAA